MNQGDIVDLVNTHGTAGVNSRIGHLGLISTRNAVEPTDLKGTRNMVGIIRRMVIRQVGFCLGQIDFTEVHALCADLSERTWNLIVWLATVFNVRGWRDSSC